MNSGKSFEKLNIQIKKAKNNKHPQIKLFIVLINNYIFSFNGNFLYFFNFKIDFLIC